MNKPGLTFSLLLIATTAGIAQGPPAGGGGWAGRGPRFAGPGGEMGLIAAGPGSRVPVTGAPYSGVESTQVQQTLADGNQITRQATGKVYRDSQGRVRMEHTMTPSGSQTAVTRISIFDPVAGYSHLLDPATQTAEKIALPAQRTNRQAAPAGPGGRHRGAGETQKTDLGTQTVNGLTATGTRVTTTIPAGAIGNQQAIVIVRETWVSTALKVPVQIKSSDPRFGTTTMNLTGIAQSEPDATLFQVPANYTVTTRGPGRNGGGAIQ